MAGLALFVCALLSVRQTAQAQLEDYPEDVVAAEVRATVRANAQGLAGWRNWLPKPFGADATGLADAPGGAIPQLTGTVPKLAVRSGELVRNLPREPTSYYTTAV